MLLTRADGILALSHVIASVFELPADHVLITALAQAGIVEIGDVLNMPYDDIMDLTCLDAQGAEHAVGKDDRSSCLGVRL
jgi:hypothetical protein